MPSSDQRDETATVQEQMAEVRLLTVIADGFRGFVDEFWQFWTELWTESILPIPPIEWGSDDCKMESDGEGLRTAGVELCHLHDVLRAPRAPRALARRDALGRHRAVLDRLWPNRHSRLSGSSTLSRRC